MVLLLLPGQVSAQDEVSLKIDFVAWGNAIGGLSLKPGKQGGDITARAFRYSEPVSYSGPATMPLYKIGDGDVGRQEIAMTDEDREHQSIPLEVDSGEGVQDRLSPISEQLKKLREETPSLVSLIRLPTGARRVTVLLAAAAEGTYQGYVINDDPTRLPVGSIRVHNLSAHEIAMQFGGGGKKVMKPRETMSVKADGGAAIYQLAYKQGEKWKVQENNIIPAQPDEQTQFIVLRSRNRFFMSSDGATGGFLQTVRLARKVE